jgi:hypothetical protein
MGDAVLREMYLQQRGHEGVNRMCIGQLSPAKIAIQSFLCPGVRAIV